MEENKNTVVEENNEQPKENFFKRFITAVKAKISNILTWVKSKFTKKTTGESDNSTDGDNKETKTGFFKNIWAKFKTWFKSEPDFSGAETVKNLGFGGQVAFRSAQFVSKLKKKIFKGKDDENSEKKVGKLAAVFHKILKVLSIIATVGFAAMVLVYAVKLLPAVLTTIAECLAVALIVELVFTVLQTATGVKTQA